MQCAQMKLLLTADLHFRLDWFRWLLEQAPNYDLICIAGDLLDMFERSPRGNKRVKLPVSSRSWRTLFRSQFVRGTTTMPVDSYRMTGRHCINGSLIWAAPKHHYGRCNPKAGSLILTTIPYHCSKEEKSIWLDRGLTIRRQTGKPWMVLHHVPPKTGPGVSGEESEATALLLAYRPDYFVSGHDHAFPYKSGQCWNREWAKCACWSQVN